MPETTRESFLRTIRMAASRPAPPLGHPSKPVTGEVGRMRDDRPLVDIFAGRAEAANMQVRRVPSLDAASEAVVAIVEAEDVGEIMTWGTPLVKGLGLERAFAGRTVRRWDPSTPEPERKAHAFAMACGITSVDYAVAETGSLVVIGRPEQGRSVSLLGRVHIAVVRAEQIVADLHDLFPRIAADSPNGIPPSVTLITGPSKTADIELNLVIGVHGPGIVYIVLVES